MIFTIIEFLCLIVLGGFFYYTLGGIAMDYLDTQVTLHPTAFNNASIVFTKSIVNWLLLLMIIGGVFSLIVWAQRTRPEGYYR